MSTLIIRNTDEVYSQLFNSLDDFELIDGPTLHYNENTVDEIFDEFIKSEFNKKEVVNVFIPLTIGNVHSNFFRSKLSVSYKSYRNFKSKG